MLGLQCRSKEEWLDVVKENPERVLCDHAHCEKKAAIMAISLMNRYPDRRELVESMIELAQEELSHMQMVLNKIYERGYEFLRDPGDGYAQALHDMIRKQEPYRLLDTLLVSSLIEARSCERFQLLSESVEDEDLALFYRSLLESEAQHRTQFLKLARLYFPREEVDERFRELAAKEAEIVTNLSSIAMMHG